MKSNHRFAVPFFCICLLACVPLANAQERQTVDVVIPHGDRISIAAPPQWSHQVIQPDPKLPPTVKISSPAESVSLLITFLPDPDGLFTTKEGVDRAVTNANQQYVKGSVEKKIDLVQFDSKTVRGCYSSFTDAELLKVPASKKGQFVKVTSGVFVIRKQGAVFTLLSNDTTGADYKLALGTISENVTIPVK